MSDFVERRKFIKKDMKIPQLYIVNYFDRPEHRLLAEKREDGLLYYIHPDLANRRDKGNPPAPSITTTAPANGRGKSFSDSDQS